MQNDSWEMEVPSIIKNGHQVISDLDLFYEIFFVGQDKRNPSNIINTGYNNKKDLINMLCSLNGYQLHYMEYETYSGSEEQGYY